METLHDQDKIQQLTEENQKLRAEVARLQSKNASDHDSSTQQDSIALENHEEWYREFMEQASDGIWFADINGNLIDVNSKICEMLGYTRAEILQLHVSQLIAPEDLKRHSVQSIIDQMKSGTVIWERTLLRKDGSTVYVELSGKQLTDKRLQAIVRDISQRKEAENALKRSEYFNRQVIENAGEGIIVYDKDLRYVVWNPTMERLTGIPAQEVLGEKTALEIFPHLKNTGVADLLEKALQGKTTSSKDLPYNLPTTGKEGWVKGTYTPYYDADGNVIGVIGIITNVTALKKAEQQTRDLSVERERVKLLRRLVNDISHDFKTPLSVIKVSSYLLQQDLPAEMKQKHLHNLDIQTSHLERLIEDILTMSSLDAGQTLTLNRINIPALLRTIETRLDDELREKEINIKLELQEDLASTIGNREDVGKAMLHIVGNAIKYSPPKTSITVRAFQQDRTAIVEIQDSGIGIREDQLPYIFEPFYRGDDARTTTERGTGLGLAIATKIIELHSGTIEAESEIDKGSLFRVTLPVVAFK